MKEKQAGSGDQISQSRNTETPRTSLYDLAEKLYLLVVAKEPMTTTGKVQAILEELQRLVQRIEAAEPSPTRTAELPHDLMEQLDTDVVEMEQLATKVLNDRRNNATDAGDLAKAVLAYLYENSRAESLPPPEVKK